MSFYPPCTVLHEQDNIRYEIYSDQYYESTLSCMIESRTVEGTIYSDFGISGETIEQASIAFINDSSIRIIAIDISLQTPIVVGTIFAEDFTIFEKAQHSTSSIKRLQILKQLNKKLMSPLTNIKYGYGDIVIGSGYGVRQNYQNLKIGNNLGMLFLSVCIDSPYKVFCGLFYSRKASGIMCKVGGFLMCQLKIEQCTEIDQNISDYMKNDIEIVAYVDINKDGSENFQILKTLVQDDQPLQIV